MSSTPKQHPPPWRLQPHGKAENQKTQQHLPTTPPTPTKVEWRPLANHWSRLGKNASNRLSENHTQNRRHDPIQPPPITHPEQEVLQDDKNADGETPHIILEYILPAQHRPTHHKPDIIRAIGYTIGPDGTLKEDPTYKGRRQLQLIECKYSTDGNITDIIDRIYTIYEPLKQALQTHGTLKAYIKIIPIVISRTGTFNVKTLAEIAQLISFDEEPPDALTYKQLPKPAQ
jgi:hypothetical protein